ncbi:NADP-dependent aldehyde dehydrogenase [Muriicola jejuensis]|uniref:Aldehyde dehydrogenase family protein n=1 Tax=Muriicola jejuensis TaxID=504488 RepID=A0A6P0UG97_9FLAO|nr:aldehyde dehydrogenase (NADP(+)) [Muriicola jejuensis]NER11460.1 aldehyde dehydrogenase family protein [Muriicola jejuensis]SMP20651.1 NADP-dependent aldehyde dehydrogenase [Muriicola jejuensis]
MLDGKNIIGYNRTQRGKVTFKTINPILNRENETVFYEASKEEVEEAVKLAHHAAPFYAESGREVRAAFLRGIASEISALGDDLIGLYCSESGLPEGRAKGERARTIGQLELYAGLVEDGSYVQPSIDTAKPDRKPNPKVDLRKMMVPIGPVVVFGASNFPLAYSSAGGDTASALAAGCPVIVKGHPMHAGTGNMVSSAIAKAARNLNLPEGVFSHLNSKGHEVGEALVKHPQVKAVGFTGSHGGGRALFNIAASRKEPIPVFAEMGSVNPVILLPEILKKEKEKWAGTIAGSVTLGSGQFCTNPGILMGIKNQNLDLFSDLLSQEILKVVPSSMLHPDIADKFNKGKEQARLQKGTEVIAEHTQPVEANVGRPTILKVKASEFRENSKLHQEVFGPFSLLVECRDIEELERSVALIEGQLTASVIGTPEEMEGYDFLLRQLKDRVGRLIFNGVPTGVEVCASMHHGGPYPATTDSRFTAVGEDAINRWLRPVCFQNCPDSLLPPALQNANPLNLLRRLDGRLSHDKV